MDSLKLVTVLLVVYAVNAAVIPCHWTQYRLGVLNRESIELLENMGDLMPLKCLENGERTFPKDAFLQAENEELAVVALETLKGVAKIFENDQAPVSWDTEKLGLFKNIMSRQVENLQKCWAEGGHSADSNVGVIKSYFEDLENQLAVKGFSVCAWEKVRDEIHHCLEKFQAFLEIRI